MFVSIVNLFQSSFKKSNINPSKIWETKAVNFKTIPLKNGYKTMI